MELHESRPSWKHLWQNEKLLLTRSYFSFAKVFWYFCSSFWWLHTGFESWQSSVHLPRLAHFFSWMNESYQHFCIGLTLYHLIPTFIDSDKEAFWKYCGKKRKCWLPAFPPFPTMFSTLPETQITIWPTFKMSSANALKLDWSKILLFGKELNDIPASPLTCMFAFAENKWNLAQLTEFIFEMLRNMIGKAGSHLFFISPFSQMFNTFGFLTLHRTNPGFDNSWPRRLAKLCWKEDKILASSIISFSCHVSPISNTEIVTLAPCDLSETTVLIQHPFLNQPNWTSA